MSKKLIIVFEGIEGSGKSFHLNNIKKYLKKKKINFISLREPGGSIGSERIRKLILNKKSNFNIYTDLLLYLAARSENIEKIILKNYRRKIILIDRFTDSTFAYQAYGMGINKKFIKNINDMLLKNIKVDFTFLNTVSNKNLKKRLLKRKSLNRYDKFDISFYNKVQKGFIKLTKMNKKKYMIIDSNDKIKHNKLKIINKIKKLLSLK
tara:strand:+ start:6518 stop:7141 length:624 start_codon:yes stop_codon:yes gene_type:complete